MNFTLLILAVIVVVLIFALYNYFSPATNLSEYANLNGSNSTITLVKPNNSVYTYGFLLYLVDNKKSGTILSVPTFTITLTPSMALQCNPLTAVKVSPSYTIMDKVPLSEWSYITVCANNKIIDFYINGKLISSNVLPTTTKTSGTIVTLGSGINAYIERLTYLPTYSTPSDVYNAYLALNNMSLSDNPLKIYTVDVSLTKNGTVAGVQTIL